MAWTNRKNIPIVTRKSRIKSSFNVLLSCTRCHYIKNAMKWEWNQNSPILTNGKSPNTSLRQYIQQIILVSLDNSRNGTGQYRQRKASHRHTRHGLILRTVRKPGGIHGIGPFHVVMNAIDGQEYGIQRNGNVGGMLPFVADAILLLGRTAVMRNDDDFETESVSQECLGLQDLWRDRRQLRSVTTRSYVTILSSPSALENLR